MILLERRGAPRYLRTAAVAAVLEPRGGITIGIDRPEHAGAEECDRSYSKRLRASAAPA
jgi:hypothetical protein